LRDPGERWRDWISDILEAVVEIQSFVEGMTFEQFRSDMRTFKAVGADLVIIGEAAGRIPESVRATHPEVPWQLMRALRNRIVHVYFDVDAVTLWDTVQHDLPRLIAPLRRALSGEDERA
jgi:uncharacterized protein with HEPN domain